jgi:hypothetical protein
MSIIRIQNIANYTQEIINGELILTPIVKKNTQSTTRTIPQLLQNAPAGKRKEQVIEVNQLFIRTLKRPLSTYEIEKLLYASRETYKTATRNVIEDAGFYVSV